MKPIYPHPLQPGSRLLLLGAFLLAGLALGAALSLLIGQFAFGYDPGELQHALASPQPGDAGMLMWINSVSQCCAFLLPVGAMLALFGEGTGFPRLRPSASLMLLAVVWIICASPAVDALGRINEWLIPEHSWMYRLALPQEEQANRLIELMLGQSLTHAAGVAGALLSVALVPAVCEEVLFRGGLQPLLVRITRSPHVGVWLTAIAFSAVHLQFFGFLPRMALGIMLGYLVWWSGSIWPALVAHFANNALGVGLYGLRGSLDMEHAGWLVGIASLVVTVLLGRFLWRRLVALQAI